LEGGIKGDVARTKVKNKILAYNPQLKEKARELRKQSTLSEILLWKKIKRKTFGVEFHRQVPIDNYIVDFFCHELMLAIEIDGSSHHFHEIELKDITRQQKLESLGIQFIRFKDKEIKQQMNGVLRTLENKIEELRSNS
jgi:very-short-patch-repair endonuclease